MNDCVLWDGLTMETHKLKYGYVYRDGMSLAIHRLVYLFIHGSIPFGYVIDHTCRNSLCMNPLHLEAVPNVLNVMRGEGAPAKNARKTHCQKGHPLSGDNLRIKNSGRRVCITCEREYNRLRWEMREK